MPHPSYAPGEPANQLVELRGVTDRYDRGSLRRLELGELFIESRLAGWIEEAINKGSSIRGQFLVTHSRHVPRRNDDSVALRAALHCDADSSCGPDKEQSGKS